MKTKTTTEKNNELRRLLLDLDFVVEDAEDGSGRSVIRRYFDDPGVDEDGAIVEVTFRGDATIDETAFVDEEVEIAIVFGGGFGNPNEKIERIVGVPITVGDFRSRLVEMTSDFLEREELIAMRADPETDWTDELRCRLDDVGDRIRRFLHNEKNTAGKRLREMGFTVRDTGGGCRAFSAVHRGRRIELLIGTASNDLRLSDSDFEEGLVGAELLDLDTGNPFVYLETAKSEEALFEWIDEVQKFTVWNIKEENEKSVEDRIRDAFSYEELTEIVGEEMREIGCPGLVGMSFDAAHAKAIEVANVFIEAIDRMEKLDPDHEGE